MLVYKGCYISMWSPGCGGFSTAMNRESMKLELWVGITQSGWSPVTWILMKWDPGGFEARGRGLDQRYQSK
jgi:hypothetical protein